MNNMSKAMLWGTIPIGSSGQFYTFGHFGYGDSIRCGLVCLGCDSVWYETYRVGDQIESKIKCPHCGLEEVME